MSLSKTLSVLLAMCMAFATAALAWSPSAAAGPPTEPPPGAPAVTARAEAAPEAGTAEEEREYAQREARAPAELRKHEGGFRHHHILWPIVAMVVVAVVLIAVLH